MYGNMMHWVSTSRQHNFNQQQNLPSTSDLLHSQESKAMWDMGTMSHAAGIQQRKKLVNKHTSTADDQYEQQQHQ